MKKIWPFSFYFWQFAGIAFWTPFFVLYCQNLGFSGPQIGLLNGLSPLITLVCAPLWTGLADATRRHRLVLSLTLLGATLALGVFPLLRAFLPVLVTSAVLSVFFAPVLSLADSASMRLLAGAKDMYGRLRLGGTLGFALAAPIAGQLAQRYGLAAAFWGGAGTYFLGLIVSQKLWPPVSPPAETVSAPSSAAPPLAAAPVRAVVQGASRALMTNPRWLLFLVGAFAGGVTLTVTNTYFFSYLKELGAPETTMGFALTLSTLFEVPLLFFGHRLLQRFKPYPLFLGALAVSGARMLLMAAAGNVSQALLLQPLAGLAFPLMWLAGVTYADESAPAGLKATAQGFFGAAVFGVGSAAGGFLGGPLLASAGAHGMFLLFGLAVVGVVAAVAVVGRFVPRVPLEGVEPPL